MSGDEPEKRVPEMDAPTADAPISESPAPEAGRSTFYSDLGKAAVSAGAYRDAGIARLAGAVVEIVEFENVVGRGPQQVVDDLGEKDKGELTPREIFELDWARRALENLKQAQRPFGDPAAAEAAVTQYLYIYADENLKPIHQRRFEFLKGNEQIQIEDISNKIFIDRGFKKYNKTFTPITLLIDAIARFFSRLASVKNWRDKKAMGVVEGICQKLRGELDGRIQGYKALENSPAVDAVPLESGKSIEFSRREESLGHDVTLGRTEPSSYDPYVPEIKEPKIQSLSEQDLAEESRTFERDVDVIRNEDSRQMLSSENFGDSFAPFGFTEKLKHDPAGNVYSRTRKWKSPSKSDGPAHKPPKR